MIPVWNGWHFTDGFTEACLFCSAKTKDLCLYPPKPMEARRYFPICSGCRRVLRRLKILSTHGAWQRGTVTAT